MVQRYQIVGSYVNVANTSERGMLGIAVSNRDDDDADDGGRVNLQRIW